MPSSPFEKEVKNKIILLTFDNVTVHNEHVHIHTKVLSVYSTLLNFLKIYRSVVNNEIDVKMFY